VRRRDVMSGLDGYLNDHLAGAAAAIQLAERFQAREGDTALGRVLHALVVGIREDREDLDHVVQALGGQPKPVKRAGALGLELLASLRMSLPILGTGSSEASRLEEIEVLILGLEGKRMMWAALATLMDPRLEQFDLARLERRASEQREQLQPYHVQLVSAASST
jgi:hypothetical protein